ncbi:mandelate racemase/muconate lactonizing protein [bacterium]|nr:mandelate racemase/muconate lactonizing protein [bacterium]
MKITRIESIPVNVPLKQGLTTRTAHGDHITSDYVIVRVYTDEGIVGLGEATVSALWSGETAGSTIAHIDRLLAPALIGADPLAIGRCRAVMDRLLKLNPFTKAAIEMALWDISGKAAGVPVYRLLGGKYHDGVPMKMMIGAFDPPDAIRLAERFLEWGVKCLKVKVGLDLEGDLARVRAVREVAGPSIKMTVDANCGWSAAVARKALPLLAEFDLTLIEQPIRPGDVAAMADVRAVSPAPIMADESVFTLTDAHVVTAAKAVDIVSVYPGKNGGIAASQEIVHTAAAAGLACHVGSNLELGIASAAMLHLACSTPGIDSFSYPADILGPHYHETDLLVEPLHLGPDLAMVPDKPGLGVELDEKLLARFRSDK